MTKNHDSSRNARRVSDTAPVQVYLDRPDRARLERLTEQLDVTKSDVLRRSLVALERLLTDPDTHPALSIIGLVSGDGGVSAGGDAAVHHDRYLAEAHERPARSARDGKRRGKS